MKRAFLLLVVLSASFAACGGSTQPASGPGMGHGAVPPGPIVPPGEAKVGDKSKCPVSGEEFVVTADSPKSEHAGKTYFFCCPPCLEKFKANPEKFSGG